MGSLTGLGQTIGTAIGGPLVGSLVGAIGSGLQSLVGLIGSIFNRGGKARRAIEEGLRDSVYSGFSGGFMAAAKSRDRKDLEKGIKEGIFQGVSDALIKSLFKTAILETGLNTLIKEFAAALVAGDHERAAAIAGQINALVPELTAIAENGLKLLEPINPYEKPKGDTGGDETAKDEGRPADYFNLPSASPQVLAAPAWVPEFGGYSQGIRRLHQPAHRRGHLGPRRSERPRAGPLYKRSHRILDKDGLTMYPAPPPIGALPTPPLLELLDGSNTVLFFRPRVSRALRLLRLKPRDLLGLRR